MSNYEWWKMSEIYPPAWIVSSIIDHPLLLSILSEDKNPACPQFRDAADDWLEKTLIVMVWGVFSSIRSIKFGKRVQHWSKVTNAFNFNLSSLVHISFSQRLPVFLCLSLATSQLWLSGYLFVTTALVQYWCQAYFELLLYYTITSFVDRKESLPICLTEEPFDSNVEGYVFLKTNRKLMCFFSDLIHRV